MDPIAESVQDAIRSGSVLPDSTVRTWQVSPSGKFHSTSRCAKRTLTVVVDHSVANPATLLAIASSQFCRQCAKYQYDQINPWSDWLAHAGTIALADETITSAVGDDFDVAEASKVIGRLRRSAEDTHPQLADACRERARTLAGLIEQATAGDPPASAARQAKAASMVEGLTWYWDIPIEPDGELDGSDHRIRYVCPPVTSSSTRMMECHPAHRAAWYSFAEAIDNGAASCDAVTAAVQAATDVLLTMPAPWDRIPDTTRFQASDFDHPVMWANAEWRAAARDECDDLARQWAETVETAAAAGPVTIVFTNFDETGQQDRASDVAISLIPAGQMAQARWVMFANVPLAVADHLVSVADGCIRNSPRHDPKVVIASESPTPLEVLSIAATIFDPRGVGPLSDPVAALSAATDLLS